MQRFFVNVKGRVQGVGFRYFCRETALEFGVSGWVKNESDGSVSLEAQASANILNKYIDRVSRGPSFSKVTDLKKDENPYLKGDSGFSIRY